MKKKCLTLFLALAMAFSLAAPALAVDMDKAETSAELLSNLGLFKGTGYNPDGSPMFSLERAPTRAEAVTILVRLLGGEEEATARNWPMPFSDVPAWAQPYVGYAYAKGYANGIGGGLFGAENPVTAAQYLTFLLRALGYADGADFHWSSPWDLSDQLGFTGGEYNAQTTVFLRADAAVIAADALYAPTKGGGQNLLEYLLESGAIDGVEAVIWDYGPVKFQTNFASFLFFPVAGSPSTFQSFKLDKVTVNGLSCRTLQVTTPDEVAAYLASIGYDAGGFGYVEITYDEAAAQAAATDFITENGVTYPLLAFSFTYTATENNGKVTKGTFTDYYYLDG